ncbi:hypothetical protein V1264_007932 [Littorina saxatilis]|uniref:Uncharacterized protein n=1 Tax=Littorina saxatilis TaxID=31220 RepID=A0AAN9G4B4_9CAEN
MYHLSRFCVYSWRWCAWYCDPLKCAVSLSTADFSTNRLNKHLHSKLKVVPSPMCPCGEAEQDTHHILQDCGNFQLLRRKMWPEPTPIQDKLYGTAASLQMTTTFLNWTGLHV